MIKRNFEIEATPIVMRRLERFFAMLHYNSAWGHSSIFAMPLDGDGSDKIIIIPKPEFKYEVNLVAGIGGTIEIAYDDCFVAKNITELNNHWVVLSTASLYKNGKIYKTIPMEPK